MLTSCLHDCHAYVPCMQFQWCKLQTTCEEQHHNCDASVDVPKACVTTCLDYTPCFTCNNACDAYMSDGICDDGGVGAEYAMCMGGTDCADCGARFYKQFNAATPYPPHWMPSPPTLLPRQPPRQPPRQSKTTWFWPAIPILLLSSVLVSSIYLFSGKYTVRFRNWRALQTPFLRHCEEQHVVAPSDVVVAHRLGGI